MLKRAIISVSDKTGIIPFAQLLAEKGVEIISTGGTAKALTEAGIKVIPISDITGYPECLDGRVKTLHPKIHGGLLAMRDNAEHMKQIRELQIEPIDLVVINLYPFKQTIQKEGVHLDEAIEKIDIGGPTMLRAAAKNYQDVTVVVDPADYEKVMGEITDKGDVSKETKFYLCYKVFEHTSAYDTLIAQYLRKQQGIVYPNSLSLTFEKVQELRYGENPHQSAVFYREAGKRPGTLVDAVQLHGKELSYNNIGDTNGALDLLREFGKETAVVAVKHANPCGVGVAGTVYEAYMKAYEADPVSIFGGIVVTNAEVDEKTAEEMSKIFLEIILAPSFSVAAKKILMKKKNIRLLELPSVNTPIAKGTWDMKKVAGGLLVQDLDLDFLNEADCQVVTKRKPTEQELKDLYFAWKVVKHTKSNGIAVAKNDQSLGIGPGQVNRIWATEQAIGRSGEKVKGAVLASDAFFPFDDCVTAAAKAGITAIIQPGGAKNDQDTIDVCDKYGMAMIFTGMRHFKH